MTHDLGIAIALREATELIVNSPKRCAVDLAKIGEKVFMLRAYAGLSADEAASREEKDKYGQLAYVQAGLKFIKDVPAAHYKATVDGEAIEGEAFTAVRMLVSTTGAVKRLPSRLTRSRMSGSMAKWLGKPHSRLVQCLRLWKLSSPARNGPKLRAMRENNANYRHPGVDRTSIRCVAHDHPG
jgi:hypothetical protein